MACRDVVICGEPLLRKKARPVREFDQTVQDLFDDMVETLIAEVGLGLAAPQIGESLQALVVRADAEPEEPIYKLLNPRLEFGKELVEIREGCLSLPTLRGDVVRPAEVRVQGLTPEGERITVEATDMLARALQHEYDHLRGVLFTDRVEPGSLVWMVPDEDEEDGFRYDRTTMREAQEAFDRLRQRRRGGD
ncbi:MAG TPA: peptide deformylase [Armatimonadota bacterium]